MIGYGCEVTINVPAEKLLRTLIAWEKYALWTSLECTTGVGGSVMDRVGAQLQAEIIEGRLKEKIVFEVSAIEANWGIAFKTVSSGRMPWEAEYRLVPNGGSSARLVQDVRLRLGGLMVLLSPLVRGEVQKKEQQEIEKLKELLETGKIWSATAPEVPIPRGLFLPTES